MEAPVAFLALYLCGTERSPKGRRKEKAQSEELDHHKVYSGGE
jgi:hypothetical protein